MTPPGIGGTIVQLFRILGARESIPKIDHGLSRLKIGRSEWPRDPITNRPRWSYRWDRLQCAIGGRCPGPRLMRRTRSGARIALYGKRVSFEGDQICPHHLIEAYVLSEKIARLNFPSAAIQSIIPW